MASAAYATAPVNGTTTPPAGEDDEELYDQLLRLRDVVIAGKHTSLKLSSAAIERLKASLIVPEAQARDSQQSLLSNAVNSAAFNTNQAQLQAPGSFHNSSSLPGLHTSPALYTNGAGRTFTENRFAASGIDPIFLEKSESLVRAERELKRQRIDRDLQAQVEQRKHSSRDRDPGVEAPSPIDIDYVLLTALERVKPISGLKETEKPGDSSSFDENDYYSSQVQSDWSSEANSSKASDKAAGAFTADFERLDGAPHLAQRPSHHEESYIPGASFPQTAKARPHVYTTAPEDVYEIGDEDDEYTPPDAAAFDSFREDGTGMDMDQVTSPDHDNSDYEPGEISDSYIPTPQHQVQQPAHPSPHVPVIRNHLTHIVAPQPNRVSPLATAKGPSIELELVNGRPEVVQRPQNHQNNFHSRASTASPSGTGVGGSNKKKKNKKRKRDQEPSGGRYGRAKRRRDKQAAPEPHAPLAYEETYIKDEPISPPPFASLPDVPSYGQPYPQQRPIDIDLSSPRYSPHVQYVNEYPRSGLRYENVQPTPPTYVRMASPAAPRPVQRDTQDLRRVASLHVAQRLPSPHQRVYSPIAPYRTASMTYGEPRPGQIAPPPDDLTGPRYQEQLQPASGHYVRDERSRSPPHALEYRDSYAARAESPAMMPPPAAPPRKIVVDQNGNKYYAAEPVPAAAPMPVSRATAAPLERRSQPGVSYERPNTEFAVPYAHVQSAQAGQYGFSDGRMAPPAASSARRQPASEQRVANGYYSYDYTNRPPEQGHYTQAPTSPTYQQVRGYEQISPSQLPSGEPTSPVYVSSRNYSARPEEPPQVLRHASVAPVQYVRREAPAPVRAVSVMPTSDYGALAPQQHQRTYSQAPQGIRYVDKDGNEVFPSQVRQVNEYRY